MSEIRFNDIQRKFDEFLMLKDKEYIRLTYAAIIGNQMPKLRPIWLMLIAPPSSGKTTALNALTDLKLINPQTKEEIEPCHNISDLTENSFASGMTRGDRKTSLLHKIPYGGMMIYKDFTSIISKRTEARMVIMGQLREIYDGAYVKRTGNGEDVMWTGKIGAIAGVTESVYEYTSSMSAMGDRFIMYQVPQPDRKDAMRFKLRKQREGISEAAIMPEIKEMTRQYLQRAFDNMAEIQIQLPEEHEDDIIDVANFCTMVRSGVVMDEYRRQIKFVPEPEMPFRMFEQMIALGSAFVFMRQIDNPKADSNLTDADFTTLYKIAFDSIPIVRRIALRYLTIYETVDVVALSRKIQYESEVVHMWLTQLNALGVVDRIPKMNGGNAWRLNDKYKAIMEKLSHAKALGVSLEDTTMSYTTDEVERHWEQEVETVQKLYGSDLSPQDRAEQDLNDDW